MTRTVTTKTTTIRVVTLKFLWHFSFFTFLFDIFNEKHRIYLKINLLWSNKQKAFFMMSLIVDQHLRKSQPIGINCRSMNEWIFKKWFFFCSSLSLLTRYAYWSEGKSSIKTNLSFHLIGLEYVQRYWSTVWHNLSTIKTQVGKLKVMDFQQRRFYSRIVWRINFNFF